jgi:hypothetical protein
MKNHGQLTDSERLDLEWKIDLEFERIITKPREKIIVDFLIKIQNFDYEFRTSKDTKQIEVISLYYYANCPLGFLFIEPCYEFYDDEKTIDRPEIHLEDYSIYDIEDLCKKVLTENNIDFSDIVEDEFEYNMFWENKEELEKKFLFECWKKAKDKTKSKLIGFLDASDSTGGTYDLENGYCLWNEKIEIEEYLKKKNITIKKDTE